MTFWLSQLLNLIPEDVIKDGTVISESEALGVIRDYILKLKDKDKKMNKISICFNVRTETIREASVIIYDCSTVPGKEIFSIEEDGTVKGSIEEALLVCEQMISFDKLFDQALPKVMIGVLRALKKLQEW